jgi:hypothetical protein
MHMDTRLKRVINLLLFVGEKEKMDLVTGHRPMVRQTARNSLRTAGTQAGQDDC